MSETKEASTSKGAEGAGAAKGAEEVSAAGARDGGDGSAEGDFARLEIETPFGREWLAGFLSDPERLLRINPFYEFSLFERTGEDAWRMKGRNLALERDFDVTFRREALEGGGFRLAWDGWLKSFTEARVEEGEGGAARIVLIDDYSGPPEEERIRRVKEVDTSFTAWGQAIWRYLANWRRWSWLPGYKGYMGRFWLNMKPAARRISFILIVLGAMELALALFVLLILWLERG